MNDFCRTTRQATSGKVGAFDRTKLEPIGHRLLPLRYLPLRYPGHRRRNDGVGINEIEAQTVLFKPYLQTNVSLVWI